MRWILAVLALCPAPAAALEICDDLWFTRNLIYDRAGYCFGSALGAAVFGNHDCTTKEPRLSGAERELVERIRGIEAEWGCAVDTTRTELNVPALGLRKAMRDLPVATGYESGCIGWKGGPLALRAAQDDIASLTGLVEDGDTLLFQFEDVAGWSFVEAFRNDVPAGAGWARIEIGEETCESLAG